MLKLTYELISYDVWGNDIDGFEVNQAFRTNTFINLTEDEADDEQTLILKLINAGILNPSAPVTFCPHTNDSEQFIYFINKDDGRPEFELQLKSID